MPLPNRTFIALLTSYIQQFQFEQSYIQHFQFE